MASSIKVAEAAKVIENTQRDVNIGLIKELEKLERIALKEKREDYAGLQERIEKPEARRTESEGAWYTSSKKARCTPSLENM